MSRWWHGECFSSVHLKLGRSMYSIESVIKHGGGWKLEVVLKIAEGCNLACEYCYFYFRGDDSHEKHAKLMQDATVMEFAGFLDRMLNTANFGAIQIDLHGGEPLLYPKQRFDSLCTRIREVVADRADLTFALQTNGTLIDEEWIRLLSKHDVAVGVSLDGSKTVNDRRRFDKQGRSSYPAAVKGLGLLKAAYSEGMLRHEPGILCVYDFSTPIEDVVSHLVDVLGITKFSILLDDLCHDSFVRAETFDSQLYSKVFELVGEREDVRLDAVWRVERQLKRRKHDEELLRYDVLRQVLITVSSDGQIGGLDQARMLSERYQYGDLHVRSAELVDILLSPAHVDLRESAQMIPGACAECCWRYVCRGGDPVHRYSTGRGFDNPSVYCDVLQDLYAATAARLIRKGTGIGQIEVALGISVEEARR